MKTKRGKREILGFMIGVILFLVGVSLIYIGLFVDEKPAFLSEDKVLIANETAEGVGQFYLNHSTQLNYGLIRPPTAIVFNDESQKELGMLDWTDGEFKFIGNADQSARVFFEYFLKPYIDQYIEDELRRKKDE